MINMTKQTWRAERLRSADIRRSAHQRTAENARKRRREDQPVNKTVNKTDEELDAKLEFLTITIFLTIVFVASYLAL